MKIDRLFERLNYLCPKPLCRVADDELTDWFDHRAQPADEDILAVDLSILDRNNIENNIAIGLKNKLIDICGDLYQTGVPPVLQGIRRRIEKGMPNAHRGYIRFNKVRYSMTEQQTIDFIDALEECAIDISDFKNNRIDELSSLSYSDLENYDIDFPNSNSWPSMPDPNNYTG